MNKEQFPNPKLVLAVTSKMKVCDEQDESMYQINCPKLVESV